jgi:hypothetical protein
LLDVVYWELHIKLDELNAVAGTGEANGFARGQGHGFKLLLGNRDTQGNANINQSPNTIPLGGQQYQFAAKSILGADAALVKDNPYHGWID